MTARPNGQEPGDASIIIKETTDIINEALSGFCCQGLRFMMRRRARRSEWQPMIKTVPNHRGFVLVHPQRGVYVGRTQDVVFWSKLDAAGRDAVATFESEATALVHVAAWDCVQHGQSPENEFCCYPVTVDVPGGWASVAALRAAGLDEHLGELFHPGWGNPAGNC